MIAPELRNTFIETGMFAGKYEQSVDRESAYELLSVRFANAGAQQTQVVQPVPMVQQSAQAEVPQQPVYQPTVFRVFNPQTGMYEEKAMDNMAAPVPMAQQPAQVQTYQQPVQMQQYQQSAPVAPAVEPKAAKPAKKAKEENITLADFRTETVSSVSDVSDAIQTIHPIQSIQQRLPYKDQDDNDEI
jgi:hypothetical protein